MPPKKAQSTKPSRDRPPFTPVGGGLGLLLPFIERWEQREEDRQRMDARALDLDKADSAGLKAFRDSQLEAVQKVLEVFTTRLGPQPAPWLYDHKLLARKEPKVPLPTPFTDARGTITNIANAPVGSVVLITSKAESTRAKHWHKGDAHVCFVMSGRIEYFERPLTHALLGSPIFAFRSEGSGPTDLATDKPHLILKSVFGPGEAFFTGSYVEHEMYFPEDTVFLTLGRLSRTPEEYEEDLVRVDYSLRDLYQEQELGPV